MTSAAHEFPESPRTLRAGLASIDPSSRSVVNVITFKYNPDSVTRTLQPRGIAAEAGDRQEALRLTGAPRETMKLPVELDAADELDLADASQNDAVAKHGLLPALAMLEQLVSPTVSALRTVDSLYDSGRLEIVPQESPLVVLVWGTSRVIPVLITSMSFTEQAFDDRLRPIRVRADVELRVLTDSDLPKEHLGTSLYLSYRQQLEQLGTSVVSTNVRPLGVVRLP